jgi:hypothetical protein
MQRTWETFERYESERAGKLRGTKCDQAAGTTRELKWQYVTRMSFVNAVMIPRPTLSNVLAAEDSALGSTPNLEDDNASTNVSINDNDSDEFSEGASDERQVKKNLGTRRKINFREEALHSQKRKIKLLEQRLIKKIQSQRRLRLHVPNESFTVLKKIGRHSRKGNWNRLSKQCNQENSNL